MSAAPAYNRTKNFLDNNSDQTDQGALNAEFDAVANTVNALRENAGLIQGDDGTLAVGIVTTNSLADDVKQLLGLESMGTAVENPSGAWEDARGLASEKSYYDGRPKGFSFLAMDLGLIYFKLSGAIGDWSAGYPFGKGDQGAQGDQGTPGAVDYSLVVRKDTEGAQSMNGSLGASSFTASQSMAAPQFKFQGAALRMIPSGTRLRLDDGANSPSLVGMQVSSVVSGGTGAEDTGFKLASGDDIATLFDPAGAAASKLAGVDPAEASAQVNITGKTTITVSLAVVNNQLQIQLVAA